MVWLRIYWTFLPTNWCHIECFNFFELHRALLGLFWKIRSNSCRLFRFRPLLSIPFAHVVGPTHDEFNRISNTFHACRADIRGKNPTSSCSWMDCETIKSTSLYRLSQECGSPLTTIIVYFWSIGYNLGFTEIRIKSIYRESIVVCSPVL